MRGVLRLLVRRLGGQQRTLVLICLLLVAIYFLQSMLQQEHVQGLFMPKSKEEYEAPDVQEARRRKESLCRNECSASGNYSYRLVSGEGLAIKPYICWNNELVLFEEKRNVGRGLNVVQIDDKTKAVVAVKNFDTFVEDADFIKYIRSLPNYHMILVACFDECARKLSNDARDIFEKYGSKLIKDLQFRDSYVLMGQKGLKNGLAIEKIDKKGIREFGGITEVRGCTGVPMGELVSKVSLEPWQVTGPGEIKVAELVPDCGMAKRCGENQFPVHVYTGKDHNDQPKVCVDGKYVVAKETNEAGRGLNFVVVRIKQNAPEVTHVAHFDTYEDDSTSLEIFLESLKEGDILIVASFDDSSRRLSDLARQMLNDLGSSQIQNLKFRSTWYMISQKGLKTSKGLSGYTPYEHLEYAFGGRWGRVIDKRLCIPYKIRGLVVAPDPVPRSNIHKREFCAKHDGYGDFCAEHHLDDPILPAPLMNPLLQQNAIYKTPILVVPGLSNNALRMTLETLIMQPGIKADNVVVMFDEKFADVESLVKLFGFRSNLLPGSKSYAELLSKAIEKAWSIFADRLYMIIIEEELVLSPDFLFFMSQMLPVLDQDDSLVAVSAWNPNGYAGVSQDAHLAHRTDDFPGLAFLIRKVFYETEMKEKMNTCCLNRTWDGWLGDQLAGRGIIIPDVSRVFRKMYEGLGPDSEYLEKLFNSPRTTNLIPNVEIENVSYLKHSEYEKKLSEIISSSKPLDTGQLRCVDGQPVDLGGQNGTFVIYYEESSSRPSATMTWLCRCFQIFYSLNHPSKVFYKRTLRFTYQGANHVIVVSSQSPFFMQKPAGYNIIKHDPGYT